MLCYSQVKHALTKIYSPCTYCYFQVININIVHNFKEIYTYFRYIDDNVPEHPCLKLIANSEQVLSTKIGRRLITMEKVTEYQVGTL